ncbi:type IV secretion system protein VirB4 [Halarcobacter mediterraneus]|uniref:Type IV secretion system protein VirB4 n=1 Tax=Halarcobacter mediterraneus TaxID=2023153 RepID=A0A4Q1AXZ5_9BACT|nr:VirB4 family type IV secretion/conjugal transfer ATPase [Halarcobacter mediterraneus]RXK13230.1 type IV secretion system protein VirB4 [Halarcobacter mediterraneus]
MEREILFKGMTRPAMLWGVPIVPLVSVSAIILLLSIWSLKLYLALIIFPVFLVMRTMALIDVFIFRLLFLKFKTNTNNKKYYGAKTFHSVEYRKMQKRIDFPEVSVLALNKNPSFEKFIPYSSLIADDIVINKDSMLMTTWEISGVPFELTDKQKIEGHKKSLNMIFKTFSTENVSFYFHNIRRDIEVNLNAEYKNKFLEETNTKYYENFKKGSLKANKLYLTLIYNPFRDKVDRSSFIKLNPRKRYNELKIYIKKMREYSSRLEANLNAFKVDRLKVYEKEGNSYSSQLEFYNYLIGGKNTKVRALNAPLNEYLIGALRNLQFNSDTVQLNYNDGGKNFARAIEIKDYTSETYIGILNSLLYLNVNYTITQSYDPIQKHEARSRLKKQHGRLMSSEDDSITQLEQFSTALDELANNEISFGNYHFSILVFSDTLKGVKEDTNKVITALNDLGLSVTLADIALPATYFSQFPTNYHLRPRVSLLSSKNYSSLIALHNFPNGRKSNNAWGDAITILKTTNNQPYYFNLHQFSSKNDFGEFPLGNFTVIGQSGSGKTNFLGFICNQLLKYANKETFPDNVPDEKQKMTLVYLDKDKGALANILAGGGRYLSLANGEPTGFNPFMVENNPTNIRSLNTLIKILVTRNGEILSTADEKKIANGIDFIMNEFSRSERKFGISLLLENMTKDFNDDNSLKSRLELWKNGKQFGWVFDNEYDSLDFPDEINFFGIDGTEFLDDKDVSAPMSFYILWRVTNLIDGRRFGLLIDECWKWLENSLVQEMAKDKLKTIRKKNGILGFGTQSASDLLELDIAKTIVEQSATSIFFYNDKATFDDYVKGFKCTEKEFKTIENFVKTDYRCLIKRTDESVVTSLDLSTIGKENISILSTGEANVESIEKIFAQENLSLEEKVNQLREYYKAS